MPNPKQLWTAVLSEQDSVRSKYDQPVASVQSYFQEFVELVGKPSTMVWGTGSLLVILGITLLILLTVSQESSVESDIARSIEIEDPISGPNYQNENPELVLPHNSAGDDRLSQSPGRISADRNLSEPSNPQSRQYPNTGANSGKTVPRGVNANISSTRGAMSKCGAQRTFEMQLGSEDGDLVLKWESVPNAAKYHLYVSDDNEILIDEFETETGTSYTLKKTLDPDKAYKWKIIITLENGQTLSVDAQKLSARDFQSNQKVRKSKAKSETRCLASQ